MRTHRPQRQNGQAMVVLCAIISILVLFVVGLFSYEVNRVEVCRTQLRSATEAAALAAAATLASQDNQDPAAAHNEAIQTAISTFTQNSVAGTGHYRDWETDRKSTRLNSSHEIPSRMPSSA